MSSDDEKYLRSLSDDELNAVHRKRYLEHQENKKRLDPPKTRQQAQALDESGDKVWASSREQMRRDRVYAQAYYKKRQQRQ